MSQSINWSCIMVLSELLEQIPNQNENMILPQSGNPPLTWKIDFRVKFGQLTVTQTDVLQNDGTRLLGVVRTDDPLNKPRLDPEFGEVIIEGLRFSFQNYGISEFYKRQCVALVQGATLSVPGGVANWIRGTKALDGLQPWSIIATFEGPDNKYPGGSVMHTGFYMGKDHEGMFMISQNMDGPSDGSNPVGGIDLRKLYFSSTGNRAANPNLYYLVTR